MRLTRRTLGALVATSAGAGLAPRRSLASDWPVRPVRIIVPFAPGGGSDVIARLISDRLSAAWRQPVVVENRAGAAGAIGAGYVARSAPDEHTLLLADSAVVTTNPSLYRDLPYRAQDFAPVIKLAVFGLVLVTAAGSPHRSLRDLLAMDRAQTARISFASAGTGTTGHLALEKLKQMSGVRFVHVPYRGAGQAINDVVGGQVDMMLTGGGVARPLLEAGRIRALGVTSAGRLAVAPDAPTFAEAGVPGFEWIAAQALFAPAGTSAAIVRRINADAARVIAMPEVRTRWDAMSLDQIDNTPEQFAAWVVAQTAEMATLIRTADVRVE
jgi:tripartite-type tricarboxylate transporter receptor subunit TctC